MDTDKATDIGGEADDTNSVAKMAELGLQLLVPIMGIIKTLIPFAILTAAGYGAFQVAKKFWREAKANEWMLVIRNGQLIKKGIGLCTWYLPGDQIITFPSLIQNVKFTALQVSSEMQGVEVSGMIIWSIYRDSDGPMSAYKYFGDDLKKSVPTMANGKIENMAIAIVRDRIANLTINDILKNRSKLRNGVKEEMQKLLTGWGIWLETCEIQDVKISSRSLFTNLQTEFREAERLKAEKISADTQNQIQQEQLERNTEFQRRQTEANTKQRLFDANQKIDLQKQEGKIYEEELLITKQRQEAENLNKIRRAEMTIEFEQKQKEAETRRQIHDQQQRLQLQKEQGKLYEEELKIQRERYEAENTKKMREAEIANEFNKKKLDINAENELYTMQLKTDKEGGIQELNGVQFATEKQQKQNSLELMNLKKDADLAFLQKDLKMKNDCYTEPVLKSMVLDTTKEIYSKLNISGMRVINLNGAEGGQDTASQLLTQMMTSYKAISNEISNND